MPQYTHGHAPAVLRSHTWRTVENSAAFLLPHLKPTDKLLDVGCGPGTITCDFATRLSQGSVVGTDLAEGVLKQARATAEERGVANVTFEVQDGTALKYADDTFDVAYSHQVRHSGRTCRPR
jgi:ubiquinone/menaquinone biosynthesis C-methylase UbiE